MGITKDYIGVVIGLCLILAGCGGGGGGDSTGSSTPSTTATGQPGDGTSFEDMGGSGQLTVAWTSNPTNVDGSCTAGIQGYRVNVGLTPGVYLVSQVIPVNELSCTTISSSTCGAVQRCSYTIRGLTAATWYIAIQTVDILGYQSGYSDPVSGTVY